MEGAVNNGTVSMKKLNESVRRILELKIRLGLVGKDGDCFESPSVMKGYSSLNPETSGRAKELSRDIAAKSITLVRNRKKQLPLDPGRVKRVLIGKMTSVSKGKEYSIDSLLERFRNRGIFTAVLEDWDPAGMENKMETLGYDWDAFIIPFIQNIHGLHNNIRPVGENAMAIWCSQMLDRLDPIAISMSSPFLLYDMPYIDSLINTYSTCPDSVDMLIKALFGEIPFNDHSPVDVGGW
jgi:beta-N-acetylhexosaminidase